MVKTVFAGESVSVHEEHFALYDVVADPGKVNELSVDAPKQRQHVLNLWRKLRMALGPTLPDNL